MLKEKNFLEKIINGLIYERKIPLIIKEKITPDENMKIEILKFISYEDGFLSIENLFNYDYPKIIIESVLLFIQKLGQLNLTEIISSYEPENYLQIKEEKKFKIYLSLTKKELMPFFLSIGFYSYINKRKNIM